MLYLFFVDSWQKKRHQKQAYQELIHMPERIRLGIINHIFGESTREHPKALKWPDLPIARKFAIILGFAQS